MELPYNNFEKEDLDRVKRELKRFTEKCVGETLFDKELLEMIKGLEQHFPNEILGIKLD